MPKTTKNKNNKSKGKKGGSSVMMAGAAGAVVGAAIGGATAVMLSDKRTRDRVGRTLSDMSGYAADTFDMINDDTYQAMDTQDPVLKTSESSARKKGKTRKN